jgi:hypothetical protein
MGSIDCMRSRTCKRKSRVGCRMMMGGGEDDQRRPIRDTGAADTWEAHTVAADTGAANIGTADTGASDTREAVSSSHPQKLKTVHDGKKLFTAS